MPAAHRTDLALEARALYASSAPDLSALSGVTAREERRDGCLITRVEVLDDAGAKALGKPKGSYRTVEFSPRRDGSAFESLVRLLAGELTALLPPDPQTPLLVLGLGNRAVTPDAIGPLTVEYTVVTRHLRRQMPETFGHLRPVAALSPGVLGDTGLESAEVLQGVAQQCRPGAVIAVDALASLSLTRLCATVQLSDAGIVPGSGVGNARQALTAETLGVPVIALGVPTVMDAATLAAEIFSPEQASRPEDHRFSAAAEMIVTPKEIDARVRELGRLLGTAISAAAHPSLELSDFPLFLS